MIIDSHVHITQDGSWFGSQRSAGVEHLLDAMDSSGTELALALPLAGHISNDFVLKCCRTHSDRLIPAAACDPRSIAKKDLPETLSKFVDQGFRAIKLHPRLNGYSPIAPETLHLFEALSKQNTPLPVVMDTLFYCAHYSLPKDPAGIIHDLALTFPDVNFVFCHAAGVDAIRVGEAIRQCPNAYIDFSYTIQRYARTRIWDDLRYLCEHLDARILYGSDFPEVDLKQSVGDWQKLLEGLSEEKRTNIFSDNFRKIFIPLDT
ncbi:amidohydrolase family protein [Maridesulfovibrio sp.]|uniref:amidohydrolase family protein n=1 Tax=Maridesulfovibrio sp. TaxID=2795000 RepID=UPI003BAB196C